jgi:uncharacterized protein (TIGR00251 family)
MPAKYGNIKRTMTFPFQRSRKGVTFHVKIEPRSSRRGICGLVGDAVKIKVHSPPVGGAANEELMEILSEELRIKKTAIKIIRGHASKNKIIEIEGMDSIPDIGRTNDEAV